MEVQKSKKHSDVLNLKLSATRQVYDPQGENYVYRVTWWGKYTPTAKRDYTYLFIVTWRIYMFKTFNLPPGGQLTSRDVLTSGGDGR